MINKTLSSDWLDGSTSGNVPFVVVQLAVAASMDMGVGHEGLVRLCRFLDMRPLSHKTFAKHVRAICETNKIVVTRVFDEAAQVVRHVYRALDPSTGDDEPPIDLTVSYNGSRMTRGHKSLYSIGFVVDVLTGLVLDLQVILYCQRCAYASAQYSGIAIAAFREWFDTRAGVQSQLPGVIRRHGISSCRASVDSITEPWLQIHNDAFG